MITGEQPARNWRLYDSGFVTQEVQHNKMDRYETAEDASVQLSLYRENADRSTLKNIRRPTVKVERRMKEPRFARYGSRIVTVAVLGEPSE